jgi:hypothetical protein
VLTPLGRSFGQSLSAPLAAVAIFVAAFLATLLLDRPRREAEAPSLSASNVASEQNLAVERPAPTQRSYQTQPSLEPASSTKTPHSETAQPEQIEPTKRTPPRNAGGERHLEESKTPFVVSTSQQAELEEVEEDKRRRKERRTRRSLPPPTHGEALAEQDGNESAQKPQRRGLLHLRLEADRDRKATFPVLEPTEQPPLLNEEIRASELIVTVRPGYGIRGGEGLVAIHVHVTRSPAPTTLVLELLHDNGLELLRTEPGLVSTKAQKLIHTSAERGKVTLEISGGTTGLGSGTLASLHFAVATGIPQKTSLVLRPLTVDRGSPVGAAVVHANMLVE